MQFNEAQAGIMSAIISDPSRHKQLEVLSAIIEASLCEVLGDPEKTNPFGVPVTRVDGLEPVELDEAAAAIGVAWLETLGQAIRLENGTVSGATLGPDFIPERAGTTDLWKVGLACGFVEGHVRMAMQRCGRRAMPHALMILASLGTFRPPKRKTYFRRKTRVVALPGTMTDAFERGELARAKAGSIVYALVVQGGRYAAYRIRKAEKNIGVGPGRLDVIGEGDLISSFVPPFKADPDALWPAVEHFVHFLDEQGFTYQRLVHRAA